MFWGITLESGKKYTQVLQHSFHVTMAALGFENIKTDPLSVVIDINNAQYVLCTLKAGKIPQQNLNLKFTEGEEVSFSVEGDGVVHLTGYLLPDPNEYEFLSDDELEDENGIPKSLEDESLVDKKLIATFENDQGSAAEGNIKENTQNSTEQKESPVVENVSSKTRKQKKESKNVESDSIQNGSNDDSNHKDDEKVIDHNANSSSRDLSNNEGTKKDNSDSIKDTKKNSLKKKGRKKTDVSDVENNSDIEQKDEGANNDDTKKNLAKKKGRKKTVPSEDDTGADANTDKNHTGGVDDDTEAVSNPKSSKNTKRKTTVEIKEDSNVDGKRKKKKK